jgi:hypothetical protein
MYLYNAKIYTMDRARPEVSALAIERGRIIAWGEEASVRSEVEACMPGFDLGGRVVIPGLVDAHIHLEHYALGLQKVDCETGTRQECLARLAERARSTPPGEWILGHGWNQNNWPEGFGSAADLDAVAPDNPVYLTAKSLHAGWANSAALRLANLNATTPDPQDGKLGRDAQGEPDGILFEGAMELVFRVIPEPSLEQVAQAIEAAQPVLWRMGLTGVHDFDRRRCFAALQLLRQREQLALRVTKSIPVEDLPHAAALGLRSGFGDEFLQIGHVKMFADGALGPQTAAMIQPYDGAPENRGMLFLDAEEICELGRLAVVQGLPLAVHAIGDRANHEVLDAFAQLRELERGLYPGQPPLRHRIEHVQVIHPDDLARLSQLDVIASMQPLHATSDMLMADRYWGRRAALSYAWRSQLEHGAVLAFGSDAPVETPNPFMGIHAAVTRRRLDGSPGEQGWYPEQRLSVQEALQAYTLGAAYTAGLENSLGRLAPGFLADLLVLDVDPFTCEADQLSQLGPAATMVDGEWVFQC